MAVGADSAADVRVYRIIGADGVRRRELLRSGGELALQPLPASRRRVVSPPYEPRGLDARPVEARDSEPGKGAGPAHSGSSASRAGGPR
jgi:hypothetical protein